MVGKIFGCNGKSHVSDKPLDSNDYGNKQQNHITATTTTNNRIQLVQLNSHSLNPYQNNFDYG